MPGSARKSKASAVWKVFGNSLESNPKIVGTSLEANLELLENNLRARELQRSRYGHAAKSMGDKSESISEKAVSIGNTANSTGETQGTSRNSSCSKNDE